jgi:hypothetical protein
MGHLYSYMVDEDVFKELSQKYIGYVSILFGYEMMC